MWEAIRSNQRKSVVLALLMLMLLAALGFVLGAALFAPGGIDASGQAYALPLVGGLFGMAIAGGLWAVMAATAYFSGSRILMAVSGARQIEKHDHPQLFNVVEEMCIASGMGKIPEVYIIDDPALNAFAAGRDKNHAAVAITSGLLARLNRDQLQGVIAHELGHIVNRDVLFMQMLGIMAGTIVMLSDLYVRGMFYSSMGGGRRRSRSSSGGKGNQAQALLMVLALVMAVLSPILAQVIYLAASRRREYLADAQSAVFTRYPEGLASALEVIEGDSHQLARVNRTTAPMFICNPYKSGLSASSLLRTHPATQERIRVLRAMGGHASYAEYQRASDSVGASARVPASAMAAGAGAPVRVAQAAPPPDHKKAQKKAQMRQATDALRSASKYAFLACACGLRLKLPPDFKREKVNCPKCHRELAIPVAALAAAGVLGKTLEAGQTPPPTPKRGKGAASEPLVVQRKPGAWTTFRCPCGQTANLAPSLAVDSVQCRKCNRTIHIEDAA